MVCLIGNQEGIVEAESSKKPLDPDPSQVEAGCPRVEPESDKIEPADPAEQKAAEIRADAEKRDSQSTMVPAWSPQSSNNFLFPNSIAWTASKSC